MEEVGKVGMSPWMCPNTHCKDTKHYKAGENCKECGEPVMDFPMLSPEITRLMTAKEAFAKTGFTNLWLCPDYKCAYRETIPHGEKCPKCGKEAVEFASVFDFLDHFRKKDLYPRMRSGRGAIFIGEEITDEQLKNSILRDLENLALHEAGTAWMRLGTLISGSSTDQIIGAGFKALIDQNKAIIKQNELIIRLLERLLEQKK